MKCKDILLISRDPFKPLVTVDMNCETKRFTTLVICDLNQAAICVQSRQMCKCTGSGRALPLPRQPNGSHPAALRTHTSRVVGSAVKANCDNPVLDKGIWMDGWCSKHSLPFVYHRLLPAGLPSALSSPQSEAKTICASGVITGQTG